MGADMRFQEARRIQVKVDEAGNLSVATDPTFHQLRKVACELEVKLRAALLEQGAEDEELEGEELADWRKSLAPCSIQLTIWRGPLGDGVEDVIELLNPEAAPLGVVLGG
jgi:hypothetical protein